LFYQRNQASVGVETRPYFGDYLGSRRSRKKWKTILALFFFAVLMALLFLPFANFQKEK
jgi:hypothetical protein